MTWQLTRTGGTIDLPDSFNLRTHTDGAPLSRGMIQKRGLLWILKVSKILHITWYSQVSSKVRMPLIPNLWLGDIEDVATSDATDLVLTNTNTSTDYDVQHVETEALRQGGGIMQVTLTFLTNFVRV